MKFVVGDACIRLLLRSANHRVVFKLTASRDSHPQFRERVFAVFEGGPPRIMSFPNYTYLRPHHTTLFFIFYSTSQRIKLDYIKYRNHEFYICPHARRTPARCFKNIPEYVLQTLGYKASRPLNAVLEKGEVFDRYSPSGNVVGEPERLPASRCRGKTKWVLSADDPVTNPLRQTPRHLPHNRLQFGALTTCGGT